ncbi:hypothetical protein DRJ48_03870 [Candidatus Woesearchaeota archaeon]|nr:MAG: hypothetical protein DRJ48_03870 [Candidatus Woesearchaeota archaeon]
MSELSARIRKYFLFKRSELKGFVIAALVMGFVLGFDDGQPEFVLSYWLFNLVNSILIAGLAVLVNISAQKVASLAKGYLLEFKLFLYGLAGGVVMGLASLGRVVLFAPFELVFVHHEGLRLGRFRYGLNYFEMGTVAATGPLASLMLAILFRYLYTLHPSFVLMNAVRMNALLAIGTMLPIPKSIGSYVFYANLTLYTIVFSLVTFIGLLLLIAPLGKAILIGLELAIFVSMIYFIRYEYR